MPALTATVKVTLPPGTFYAGDYTLDLGTCTGVDDIAVRRETGFTIFGLLEQVGEDNGLALMFVCTVAWLVRKKDFPGLQFTDVLASVSWGSDWTFDLDVPGTDDDEGKGVSGNVTPASSELSPTSTGSDPGTSTV